MDAAVVDATGLVAYLENRLGRYVTMPSFNDRLREYYLAADSWFAKRTNKSNIIYESFEEAKLSTARQLLQWRDQLKLAGWDFVSPDSGSRLGALAGIEQLKTVKGLPDRIYAVIEAIEVEGAHLNDVEIVLQVEQNLFRPVWQKLLTAVAKCGATVSTIEYAPSADNNLGKVRRRLLATDTETDKLELSHEDPSLRVLEFDTAYHHDQYIAESQLDAGHCVWVNPHTKETDSRMLVLGRPTVGSTLSSSSRITDMLPLALALYDEPLNIYKLTEWLTTPAHPLPGAFRYELARKIIKTGGFDNDECEEVIQKYIKGKYDKPTAATTAAKKTTADRRDNLDLYLPYYNGRNAGKKKTYNAGRTIEALGAWAQNPPEDGPNLTPAQRLQLNVLAESVNQLMALINANGQKFDLKLAAEWLGDVQPEVTMPHCRAEAGAIVAVNNPHDMATTAQRVLWSGLRAPEAQDFDCDFLLNCESTKIKFSPWARTNEGRYRHLTSIMPLLLATESLTLCYALSDGDEALIPHPLITRLRTLIADFDDSDRKTKTDGRIVHVKRPDLDELKQEPVDTVPAHKRLAQGEHCTAQDISVHLPERFSPTSIEKFTMYPFDYLFEKVLRYTQGGMAELPRMSQTKGKVAHAVIAELCSPASGQPDCDADEISQRFTTGYDNALSRALNRHGALLLLPEHKLDYDQLNEQLNKCIVKLIDIIRTNDLRVTGCETKEKKHITIKPQNSAAGVNLELEGDLDMKLIDSNQKPVVFDLKWSTEKKFQDLLTENRSMQLAIYAELLAPTHGVERTDVRTGYFVMPAGRLLTTDSFKGDKDHVVNVSPSGPVDVYRHTLNSLSYRIRQFKDGIVEQGEKMEIAGLKYDIDRQCNNDMLELEADSKKQTLKAANQYSKYTLFKGKVE